MKVLGIESSADETSAAVVEDGKRLLSQVVSSQIDIHAQYGGIVPEVAARSHMEVINPVIEKALADAGTDWDDIDAIAVTYAPGLIGSLLIGTLAARTLAIIKNKPLYPVHHVEAHVYANFIVEDGRRSAEDRRLKIEDSAAARDSKPDAASATDPAASRYLQPELVEAPGPSPESGAKPSTRSTDQLPSLVLPKKQPDFPLLALIVSGGHTQLVLFRGHGDYEVIGRTQDDAVGEAFDKVAKIIGLPYPGGPSIARAAEHGDAKRYKLPKAKLANAYDFSFSGLKTAVLRAVQREVGVDIAFPSYELAARLDTQQRHDFAASFQHTAVETLVDATERAFYNYAPQSVVIAGGVAANQLLRERLSERLPIKVEYAPMALCTDNAAMIATLGYYQAQSVQPTDPRTLEVIPSISMTKTAWAA